MSDELSKMLSEIPQPTARGTARDVQSGPPIPPHLRVLIYSAADWEQFIFEWVHSQKTKYLDVRRLSGPNDMGIDIVGFSDSKGLSGVWDNYQCKHYANSLIPSDVAAEIAKILWHSFNGHFVPPRKCDFIAPKGCGTSLSKLIAKPDSLKSHVLQNWDAQCARAITTKEVIALAGTFKAYVEGFDFSIFCSSTLLHVIEEHSLTPYHAVRFGGGLPDRPPVPTPPGRPSANESRYVKFLLEAYGDHTKTDIIDLTALAAHSSLLDHFNRQRELFYHAEALRTFARDTVPPGTFEDLQSEVHSGVVDVAEASHTDGYVRLNAVMQSAAQLPMTANPLMSAVKIQDKKGICHQLANDDKLRWVKHT